MMNHNNSQALNTLFLDQISTSQKPNFDVAKNRHGEPIYNWIGCRIDALSSWKLWDILLCANQEGCGADENLIKEVKAELQYRNEYDENRPWRRPQ